VGWDDIAGIMQGYWVKLLGGYRLHVHRLETGGLQPLLSPGGPAAATGDAGGVRPGSAGAVPNTAAPLSSASSGGLRASASTGALSSALVGGDGPAACGARRSARHSLPPDALVSHGHWFDHAGLIATHRCEDAIKLNPKT
jgi:hypothetical protein